jgi:alkaline phosphatase D
MFSRPDAPDEVGVHLILLDVRTFRSPTFPEKGYCEGAASTMLGEKQWAWLQVELRKPSKVKVIGTGMQVMQPTDQQVTDVGSYCANDGASFFDAINVVGEDARWLGTQFEGWNQIPQEKAKLLQLLQSCINEKNTDRIVLISGDTLWGDVLAKRMPDSDLYGPSLVLYEVTSSGIEKNWPYPDPNSNRLRFRTCDSKGDGVFQQECTLPFIYNGVKYEDCTDVDEDMPWCATAVDSVGNYFPGSWGYCLPEVEELVPLSNQTASNENTCGRMFHICNAQSNYGGIEVDWESKSITMSIFTPYSVDPVAAQVVIGM